MAVTERTKGPCKTWALSSLSHVEYLIKCLHFGAWRALRACASGSFQDGFGISLLMGGGERGDEESAYLYFRDELHTKHGMVLRCKNLVIPPEMLGDILSFLNAAHVGAEKMKARALLPAPATHLQPQTAKPKDVQPRFLDIRRKQHTFYNRGSKPVPERPLSARVMVCSVPSRTWSPATLSQRAGNPRSYVLESDGGRQFQRTREHIRLLRAPVGQDVVAPESSSTGTAPLVQTNQCEEANGSVNHQTDTLSQNLFNFVNWLNKKKRGEREI
ncbi:hypothetical protein HPB49_012462 [Dermacentor silvarum]|uniref:Uncharacterized protein n=1 Tax=Dermacentor silvarum TaxID=543639 RepID=A0ACB8D4W5_DERSI|nr:hypothetical protein HPB49_012462 [Dermacentor silvarum]